MVSSDSAYKANYLAWFDFSVAIGIFLFDLAENLIHFAYSYMVFGTLILHAATSSKLIHMKLCLTAWFLKLYCQF